ncbi:2-polyprenylphenol 6-hydroxylase [candidate division KSB1 bacterium]|nr:2-polyprenylphenol 6-hydroxylase [candidate division KSB1 bacterium]
MQVTRIARTYRNLKRYRQILMVLLRYGFGDIIDRIGIGYYIKMGKKIIPRYKNQEMEKITTAKRLRLAFEELGPTFIKFGQILSVRPDLIPAPFILEFQKLQDDVPPFPSEQAYTVIEKELGQPASSVFTTFSDEPVAAASIAQVHRAKTIDGKSVAVKIQRPGIRKTIETDISILFDLAELIDHYIPETEVYNPIGIAHEFARTIRRELDFTREARNMDRFRRNFKNDTTIYIPDVYWELTTDQVLTMEFIDGTKVSEFDKLLANGLDKKTIARNGGHSILKQVFEHGFFHADPHPGNVMVLSDNVLVPLDYGMMGTIDDELRDLLGDLMHGIITKDVTRIIRVFAEIGIIDDQMDERALRNEITDFIERYYQIPLYQLNVELIIGEFSDIVRRHHIQLPTDFVLMGKVLVIEEGVGRTLDPTFDFITMARPYIQKLMLKRFDPRRHLKEFTYMLDDMAKLVRVMPVEIKTIMSKIKKGELNIRFEHRGLQKLILELDRSSNRLGFSLVIAALIVGSSLVMQLDKGPLLMGYPILGVFGYVIAAFLGLWLGIAILRSGRL